MSNISLIEIDDLSKPATVLIEKISNAVGGIFKPHQMVRVAKAEAEVEKIRAKSEIEIKDIHRRAMHRFLEEEAQKQLNIENITRKALPHLDEDSSPQDIKNDWITNFFDKCRIVSNDDLQELWSKVLAGEANQPGKFSRKTINILNDLEQHDAELFECLCNFSWKIDIFNPLVYDLKADIYRKNSITFDTLSHLETLGLILFDPSSGFDRTNFPKRVTVSYFKKSIELTLEKDAQNNFYIGYVLLTKTGKDIFSVCKPIPVEGFFEYVFEIWKRQSLVN